MPSQVKVEDLEVFRLFRAALLKFAQAAEQALGTADSQIARTHSWLETEQATFWQAQLRKRTEAAAVAREALRQKKLYKDSSGRTPGAVEEEKILARCLAAVAEAQQKIDAVRKWLPRLEKEADLCRGGIARLGQTVTVEVPQAVALLDRLAARLEEYVQIEAPSAGVPESAAPATLGESISRGGDLAAPPPPHAADTAQAASTPPGQAAAPTRKEDRHVPDGQ